MCQKLKITFHIQLSLRSFKISEPNQRAIIKVIIKAFMSISDECKISEYFFQNCRSALFE